MTAEPLSIEERSKLQADMNGLDLLGLNNPQAQAEFEAREQRISDAASIGDLTAAQMRLAPFITAYQYDARMEMPYDPKFNLEDHRKDLTAGVPATYLNEFATVRSLAEGHQLRRDILQRVADEDLVSHAGVRGFAAGIVPALVDPVNIITGFGFFGRGVYGAFGGAARGFGAGVASQGVVETFSPTSNKEAILDAGLTAMAFGATVHRNPALLDATQKAHAEMRANAGKETPMADEAAPVHSEGIGPKEVETPTGTQQEAASKPPSPAEGTAGAASIYPNHIINDPVDLGGAAQKYREEALRFNYRNNLEGQFDAAFTKGNGVSEASKKFYDVLKNIPVLSSDWDKWWNAGSPILRTLNYKLLESPGALVVNNKSAAILEPQYRTRMTAPVIPLYDAALADYLKLRGAGGRLTNPAAVRNFHREIMLEMNARLHDGTSHVKTKDPHVAAVADAIDVGNQYALDLMKGKAGETAVKGSEELKFQSGWMRQIWDGQKIKRIIDESPANRVSMEHALAQTYLRLYPAMKLEDANIYAKAVVRGALARNTELDTNMARFITQDGRDVAVQLLKDNGVDAKQAESIVDAIKGKSPEAGLSSSLRSRLDVDLRQPLPGTNYTVLDMINTDVPLIWQKYARQVSGLSAMARHGIQKQEIPNLIDAVLLDLEASGVKGHGISKKQLQDVFSYFTGAGFNGGLDPWVRRALGVSNLALLSANGLTQMAELGAQIGAVGWKAFSETAPKEFRDMLAKRNTPAMESLANILAPVRGEERLFGTHYGLEELSGNAGALQELGAIVDKALVEGRKIQGIVNGFHFIRQFQERNALRSMVYRFGEHFKGENPFSSERMYSLGFTNAKLEARIGKYFTDGTVLYDGKQIQDFQFSKWKANDIDDFTSILQRHVGQVVQQINAGEGSTFFGNNIGAILYHLKRFPLVAMQKQLLRNTRIMDAEAVAVISYSLATAGIVFSAKQLANGNTDRLNPRDIALGAMSMGNMTGWFPMLSDPIMSVLGQDNLRFSQYGPTGASTGVFDVPPVFPTFNRMAHIPKAVVQVVTGNGTKSDVSALKATPIIGNAVGMSNVWNAMLPEPEAPAIKESAPKPKVEETPKPKPSTTTSVPESSILKDLGAQ